MYTNFNRVFDCMKGWLIRVTMFFFISIVAHPEQPVGDISLSSSIKLKMLLMYLRMLSTQSCN